MTFSIYSFSMAVLWSSIFISLLCFCRRTRSLVVCFGVWPLVCLIVCALLRCFIPLEMLSFTRVVTGIDLINTVDYFLTSPVDGLTVMPIQILGILWGLGTLFFLVRFLRTYGRFRRLLSSFVPVEEEDEPFAEAQEAASRLHIPKFTIYVTNVVQSPAVTGFFHPIVLFPAYPYSSEDFSNALEHEFTHWKNHDIWVKFLVELLRDAFWWNPLVYLLKHDLNQTLELKCDLTIASKRELEDRVSYLRTMEKTICFADKKDALDFSMFAVAELAHNKEKNLLQRADAILNYEHKPKRVTLAMAVTSIIMAALMAFFLFFCGSAVL
ncbi:M56 family metallopeptidase [Acutalibacter sp. JLR.KK004]|uniref:M56 family metallopeptidase n=1 Tax=Acutalibacter sp. JLR.KK004 TaxID=3112622 RepID=UPI002FF3A3ED